LRLACCVLRVLDAHHFYPRTAPSSFHPLTGRTFLFNVLRSCLTSVVIDPPFLNLSPSPDCGLFRLSLTLLPHLLSASNIPTNPVRPSRPFYHPFCRPFVSCPFDSLFRFQPLQYQNPSHRNIVILFSLLYVFVLASPVQCPPSIVHPLTRASPIHLLPPHHPDLSVSTFLLCPSNAFAHRASSSLLPLSIPSPHLSSWLLRLLCHSVVLSLLSQPLSSNMRRADNAPAAVHFALSMTLSPCPLRC
jgi:hypothetical protein